MGILKSRLYAVHKRASPCSKATKRKVVSVIQDVINIASSFNFRTSKINLLASVQGTWFETWQCLLFRVLSYRSNICVTKSLENNALKEVSHGIFSFIKTFANILWQFQSFFYVPFFFSFLQPCFICNLYLIYSFSYYLIRFFSSVDCLCVSCNFCIIFLIIFLTIRHLESLSCTP